MNTRPSQPFGRRGSAPAAAAPRSFARPVIQQQRSSAPAVNASPELIAAILRPEGGEAPLVVRPDEIVPRSYRAAILAGFIVAILNAAVNVTFAAKATDGLGIFSLGSAKVPVAAALILGALWSAAQSSAICLLVAHRLLVRMQHTSYAAYVTGAGAAALGLAAIMWVFGSSPGPGGFAMALFSGMVTGLFYRIFAGTKRQSA
jgi:hypothetical protein